MSDKELIAELQLHEMRNVLQYPNPHNDPLYLAQRMSAYCSSLVGAGYRIHLTVDLRKLPSGYRVYSKEPPMPIGVKSRIHKIVVIDLDGNEKVLRDRGANKEN